MYTRVGQGQDLCAVVDLSGGELTPQSAVSFLLCGAKLENEEEPEDYDEEVREFSRLTLPWRALGFHGYRNTLNNTKPPPPPPGSICGISVNPRR